MMLHPQVRIRHGKNAAGVDRKLAPLIRELWRAGWETIRSCQEHTTGMVWIEFAQAPDVEAFLNVVAPFERGLGSLHDRAKAWSFGQFEPTSGAILVEGQEDAWQYHVSVTDGAYNETAQKRVADEPAYMLTVSVLFPRRDLRTVLKRVRAHNRRSA